VVAEPELDRRNAGMVEPADDGSDDARHPGCRFRLDQDVDLTRQIAELDAIGT
jgi:hypothetical protein